MATEYKVVLLVFPLIVIICLLELSAQIRLCHVLALLMDGRLAVAHGASRVATPKEAPDLAFFANTAGIAWRGPERATGPSESLFLG
jgi:hypothetical protein